MKLRDVVFLGGAVGVGMLAYGALVEAQRLVVERRTLALPNWPERLRGYRICVLSDFHVSGEMSATRVARAIALALDEEPDMIVLAGDFVESWREDSPKRLGDLLEPLLLMNGNVVAIPGNHDYNDGTPEVLGMILAELNIKLLRNENWRHSGITWIGIDSFNRQQSDVSSAFKGATVDPAIVLWHEPDLVGSLPRGAALQISGHAHGGQFILPGGWAPVKAKNGSKYSGGYYPEAPTPLFVSRGIGTTFFPSRFQCAPEVAILTLVPKTS